MIKIALCGFLGRMGSSIIEVSKSFENLQIKAGIDKKELLTGKYDFAVSSNLEDVIKDVDVVIEFTGDTKTALSNTSICATYHKPIVIGTTGFEEHDINTLKDYAKEIPIVFSPNMSIGVNVLFKLLEIATKALKEKGFDIEISEIHHKFKKDAPSGTALKLLEVIKNQDPSLKEVHGRSGLAPRADDEVGVFALRGGDVVGEHTVYLFGMGERLELTHRATDRKIFAKGSLESAKWVYGKPAGFYSMFDVLGL